MIRQAINYRLECTQCGKCCTKGTESSSTFLYIDDIEKISHTLNISVLDFLHQYADINAYNFENSEGALVKTIRIVLKGSPSCIFLKENLCSINHSKPFICEHGPFLKNIMDNSEEWNYWLNMCEGLQLDDCSTSEQKDKLLSIEDIEQLQNKKEAHYFEKTHSRMENEYTRFINNSKVKHTTTIKI